MLEQLVPVAGITIKIIGDSAASEVRYAYVTKISTLLGERFQGAEPVRRRSRTSGDGKSKY